MKEVKTEFKERTIAIDFDGVVHRYSKGYQGLQNAYDPPTEGTQEALDFFKEAGYRLIIVSSRPVQPIKDWLLKYNMAHYFDDVSNIKHPALYYIDDHAIRFPKESPDAWSKVVGMISRLEGTSN